MVNKKAKSSALLEELREFRLRQGALFLNYQLSILAVSTLNKARCFFKPICGLSEVAACAFIEV